MAEHSPLPWYVGPPNCLPEDGEEGSCGVNDSVNDMTICDTWPSACIDGDSPALARANAEFIVRACNSHDELLAALKAVAAAHDKRSLAKIIEVLEELVLPAIAKAEGVTTHV